HAGGKPHQALLPASRRPCAGDCASAHHDRARSAADARAAWRNLRAVPADLCAGYSRRRRQGSDRSGLSAAARRCALRDRTAARRAVHLSSRQRAVTEALLAKLEQRLGALHARQRLGIEVDHEAQVFGQGLNFFHPENWYASASLIRAALKLTGL